MATGPAWAVELVAPGPARVAPATPLAEDSHDGKPEAAEKGSGMDWNDASGWATES